MCIARVRVFVCVNVVSHDTLWLFAMGFVHCFICFLFLFIWMLWGCCFFLLVKRLNEYVYYFFFQVVFFFCSFKYTTTKKAFIFFSLIIIINCTSVFCFLFGIRLMYSGRTRGVPKSTKTAIVLVLFCYAFATHRWHTNILFDSQTWFLFFAYTICILNMCFFSKGGIVCFV